jgi:hypothetical protein
MNRKRAQKKMTTFKNAFSTSLSGPSTPLFSPAAKHGVMRYKGGPGQPWRNLDHGIHVIPDFGCRFHGGIAWEDDKPITILALDGEPSPDIPNDGRHWQPVMNFPVLVEGLGLAMFSTTSGINQRRAAGLMSMWSRAPQAVAGQLQEFITREFETVTTSYGDYFGLVWEPTDQWHDRDAGTFGTRLIAPPSPMLAAEAAKPMLPHVESSPTLAPVSTSVSEPKPANDEFARFRPAGADRKPY